MRKTPKLILFSDLLLGALMFAALILNIVFFVGVARAAEKRMGTITGSASQNNTTTAAAFTVTKGAKLVVQCGAYAVRYKTGNGSSTSAGSTDLKIDFAANPDGYLVELGAQEDHLAIVRDGGGSYTCEVYARYP